jgi:hypothetical protein
VKAKDRPRADPGAERERAGGAPVKNAAQSAARIERRTFIV